MIEHYKNLSLESLFYVNKNGLVCQEEWRDMPNKNSLYKISDLGRAKSMARISLNSGAYGGKISVKEKILKQNVNSGYLKIGKGFAKVHQLVAMAFLDHVPCGYTLVVDHINNNPLDNRLSNLQIITQRENIIKEVRGRSKFTGVYWGERQKKWIGLIRYKGKSKQLGSFNTEEEAAEIHKKATELILKGEDFFHLIKKRNVVVVSKGIYEMSNKKFQTKVTFGGKTHSLGIYETIYEAEEIRQNALDLLEKGLPINHLFSFRKVSISGHIGVIKSGLKFIARARINSKLEVLGKFDTIEEAADAYKNYKLKKNLDR